MGGCRAVGDCIIKKDMGFNLMAKTLKPNIYTHLAAPLYFKQPNHFLVIPLAEVSNTNFLFKPTVLFFHVKYFLNLLTTDSTLTYRCIQ